MKAGASYLNRTDASPRTYNQEETQVTEETVKGGKAFFRDNVKTGESVRRKWKI